MKVLVFLLSQVLLITAFNLDEEYAGQNQINNSTHSHKEHFQEKKEYNINITQNDNQLNVNSHLKINGQRNFTQKDVIQRDAYRDRKERFSYIKNFHQSNSNNKQENIKEIVESSQTIGNQSNANFIPYFYKHFMKSNLSLQFRIVERGKYRKNLGSYYGSYYPGQYYNGNSQINQEYQRYPEYARDGLDYNSDDDDFPNTDTTTTTIPPIPWDPGPDNADDVDDENVDADDNADGATDDVPSDDPGNVAGDYNSDEDFTEKSEESESDSEEIKTTVETDEYESSYEDEVASTPETSTLRTTPEPESDYVAVAGEQWYIDFKNKHNLPEPYQLGESKRLPDLETLPLCRCPRVYWPACGTNDRTYLNVCLLTCMGAKLKRYGTCINYRRLDEDVVDVESDT